MYHVDDSRKKIPNKENSKCKGLAGSMSDVFQESRVSMMEWKKKRKNRRN